MKRIFVVALLGLSAMACGNECDDAADKVEECGIADTGGGDSGGSCEGVAECGAKCINEASCEDLKSTDPENSYIKCASACVGG
ncbi:MAG TPA: hypothetical protein VGK73_25785 [Polyangiaceae bacterium]